jgi:hypothetical protein
MDDFRATATAFSQLTGVLGGFSMTILVLVLGLIGENKVSRDWTVALLLVAATAYIFAAGLLANCMNVGVLATLSKGRIPVFQIQLRTFSTGIRLFHLGNVFLPVAIVVTVYQESLLVGLIASIVIFLITFIVVAGNFLVPWLAGKTSVKLKNGSKPDESEQVRPRVEGGLGWPS